MADFRLYKDFYSISCTPNNTSYTLINPFSISGTVVNRIGDVLIETVSIVQESTGIYYAILTPNLYSYNNVYEVRWVVTYVDGTSSKLLKTRFRFEPISTIVLGNIISDIGIEIDDIRVIECNLDYSNEIIIETIIP